MAYVPGTSEYLLELIRCGLNGLVPKQKPDDVSWQGVYAFAKEHGVSSLAYHVAESLLPETEECASLWRDSYDKHMIQEANQNFELKHLCGLFAGLQIPHAPLKGSCIRELFPISFLREMCDLDILIPRDYLLKVHQLMLEQGYSYEEAHTTSHNREYHKKPYLNVEIHTDLLPKDSDLYWYYENIWDRLISSEEDVRYSLTWDDFYIFSIAHAYKHYCLLGIGIRSVLDLYVLNSKLETQLCRDYILKELDCLGLLDFHRKMEELGTNWFSVEKTACSSETAILGQEILNGAVYGHDFGTVANAIGREVRKGKSLRAAKCAYSRQKIFPGLPFMRSAYPILNKVPFLYPLFWPVRWISILYHKPKVIKKHFDDTRSVNL